jgi:hypothetical protein
MGFMDKMKNAAGAAANVAKASIDATTTAVGAEVEKKKAADYAKENEGLSQEEIVIKDDAKKVIYLSKVEYGKSVDVPSAVADSMVDQMAYGSDFSGANALANTHTGLTVKSLNSGERRIKYLYFTFSALNRVGEVYQTETLKQMGPIEPGKKASAFSKDFFNESPDSIILNKVVLEYFEGEDTVFEGKWVDKLVKKYSITW